MSRSIRFRTAAQVAQAFPQLREQISATPGEQAPAEFARRLAEQAGSVDAVIFCAFLLPRYEAVVWASRCLEDLGALDASQQALADAVERWLEDPDDTRREAALRAGLDGDRARPATWLALAAGWSGGSLVAGGDPPVPPPPHMTSQLAAGAIVLALSRLTPYDRDKKVAAYAKAAVAYAEGGEVEIG